MFRKLNIQKKKSDVKMRVEFWNAFYLFLLLPFVYSTQVVCGCISDLTQLYIYYFPTTTIIKIKLTHSVKYICSSSKVDEREPIDWSTAMLNFAQQLPNINNILTTCDNNNI